MATASLSLLGMAHGAPAPKRRSWRRCLLEFKRGIPRSWTIVLGMAVWVVFKSRYPGRIRDKETLIGQPGYAAMERNILKMMREETLDQADQV